MPIRSFICQWLFRSSWECETRPPYGTRSDIALRFRFLLPNKNENIIIYLATVSHWVWCHARGCSGHKTRRSDIYILYTNCNFIADRRFILTRPNDSQYLAFKSITNMRVNICFSAILVRFVTQDLISPKTWHQREPGTSFRVPGSPWSAFKFFGKKAFRPLSTSLRLNKS